MQHRYVGDIGDYVKHAVLRHLSPGHRLGVAWFLFPDEAHNRDGRHIGYLDDPERWRAFDPEVFDALRRIVKDGRRHVSALEGAGLLPSARFSGEMIPTAGPVRLRAKARMDWFASMLRDLADADLVFVDPDNGLEPAGFSHGSAKAGKSVTLDELRALVRPGRCLIVYHHQSRRKGGHLAEIAHWAGRLRERGFARVDALRVKPLSPRVYFLLDAPDDVRAGAAAVAARWDGWIKWMPGGGAAG